MNDLQAQRGVALITVLGLMSVFLLVAVMLLSISTQNSTDFGNAYEKQRYFDVAEAGIDRGMADLDSVIPSPGASAPSGTPPPPPSPPALGTDQTPLPNVPRVPYTYSYWINALPVATATSDPYAGRFGVSTGNSINVPPNGAVVWSNTDTGLRDVAVEAIVNRFHITVGNCAICAGQNVTVTGSQNFSPPPTVCGSSSNPDKVCSDPRSSPSPAPTSVPIIMGGSYGCSGAAAKAAPCAYGDGTSTPDPSIVTQNAPPGTLSGFLASQATIDAMSNAAAWKQLAGIAGSNVSYVDCKSGCTTSTFSKSGVAPAFGQVTFLDGSVNLSSKTPVPYGGLMIIAGCLNISQPGLQGTSSSAATMVLGTDAACGGNAITIQGGGNTQPPLWDGGIAYAVQGSISISGNGSVRGYNFYGAALAAGNVTVTGNGFFAWESSTVAQTLNFGLYVPVSFAQY